MSLDGFLRAELFRPLGMHDTYFAVPVSEVNRLVPLREGRKEKIEQGEFDPLDKVGLASRWALGRQSTVLSGGGAVEVLAGGLVSTLHDYVAFLRFILAFGVAPDGRRLLASETVESAASGRHLELASGGRERFRRPGRSYSLFGEVVASGEEAAGLVSWGGSASTYFGIHLQHRYAFVLLAQAFGARKPEALFERDVCKELALGD